MMPPRDMLRTSDVPRVGSRPQRYSVVRPLRDLVLIRVDQEASRRMWSGILISGEHRAFPTGIADVIAAGPLCPSEVRPGARVIVETMAGPECGNADLDGADLGLAPGRLAFVHCRNLRSSEHMEERGRRWSRCEELRKEIQVINSTPWRKKQGLARREVLVLELEGHLLRIKEIDEDRKHRARSLGIKPVKDPGLARGILAVLEEES